MDSGFYAAVNGARRMSLRMDILANNLANVNTTGFKEDRVMFDSYMTAPGPEQFPLPTDSFMGLRGPGDIPFPYSNPASNAYRMTYPTATETVFDATQGPVRVTGNPLDVAIEGEGYFAVETPQGRAYTRDGSFKTNGDGQLVTQDGFAVLGAGNTPINLGESNKVDISKEGFLSNENGEDLGQLVRVRLPKDQMVKSGQNMFRVPVGAEQPIEDVAGSGGFHQGHLEGSNANTVQNMTKLIETQRHYESYMKMIQALDGLDDKAANQIGRIQG